MLRITKILFILLLTISSVKANEVINKIVINGNQRISEETIKIYGEIDKNQKINESKINLIIKNLYSTNFFEDVDVSYLNKILTINLKEYPIVNQLIIIGEKNNKIKSQIKKLISLKEKRSFIKSKLSNDLEIIKTLYASIGYNFSIVEAKIKEIDNNNYDLIFLFLSISPYILIVSSLIL